jgi:exopolysaccharide biosynthesis protein
MHVLEIDLTAPGIRFELTPPGGSLETVRRTTLEFLREERAQIAINSHFFLPFPSAKPDAMLIGLAVSNGNVYSGFESPGQSYAIVSDAPALNIDMANHAAIVHRDSRFSDGKHVREDVMLWNALAGSAQIVTDGVKTIPVYKDAQHPDGLLTPGGPGAYSNRNSWYDALNARTAIGLTRDTRTLVLLTIDRSRVGEVADVLIRDYAVRNALNLDGGGSSTLVMENPATHAAALVNDSSDNPAGRSVGSNLAIFARTAGR